MSELKEYDLMEGSAQGGCSAKIPPGVLSSLLADLPFLTDDRVMVDISSHDDAGVYRLSEDTALIVTTDFFPPVCSDARLFGEIAATNALSDVYAMGGRPLLALNLNMFPSKKFPLELLKEILMGGQEKINEAGALTMGGHTIEDDTPKYGLAVVGVVHPDRLISNAGAQVGQKLVLTKPLGIGVLLAAKRLGMAHLEDYEEALKQMRVLNKTGAELMQKYGVKGATDITGFGLLGHAKGMAIASGVTLQIEARSLPIIHGVQELLHEGVIPGTILRNREYVAEELHAASYLSAEERLIAMDAQTSGGLLIAVDAQKADLLVADLIASGLHPSARVIGEVIPRRSRALYLV